MLRTRANSAVLALVSASICSAQLGLRSQPDSHAQVSIARAASLKAAKVTPLPACPAKFDDSLETDGVVPEGMVRGVTLPKPLHTPEAEFSDRARMEVVGTDGNPRDLCVKHSSPFDLDEQAAKAVRQYRFEPATKDGQPVAKRIAVVIRFAIR